MQNRNNIQALQDLLTGEYNQEMPLIPAEEYDPMNTLMVDAVENLPQPAAPARNIAALPEELPEEQLEAPVQQASQPPADDPLQNLLRQYQEVAQRRDAGIEEGREADRVTRLLGNIHQAGTTANQAMANRSGFTDIKLDPMKLDPSNFAKDEMDMKKSEIGDLLNMYKLRTQEERLREDQERRAKDFDLRERMLGRTETTEKRLLQQNKINTAKSLLSQDPRFKHATEQIMELDKIDQILGSVEKGNEMAIAALGTTLAKAMGERGMLTDADVVRYMNDTSWGRKFLTWAKKGAEGTLPKETLKDLKSNIGNIRNSIYKTNEDIYSKAAGRMKTAYKDYDVSDEEIRGLLGVPVRPQGMEGASSKAIKQRFYSPSRDQTKIVYADGSEEIVEGKK